MHCIPVSPQSPGAIKILNSHGNKHHGNFVDGVADGAMAALGVAGNTITIGGSRQFTNGMRERIENGEEATATDAVVNMVTNANNIANYELATQKKESEKISPFSFQKDRVVAVQHDPNLIADKLDAYKQRRANSYDDSKLSLDDVQGLDIIRPGMFENRKDLTKFVCDAQHIGANAFENCSNLKHIDVTNVKDIGECAFADCKNLEELYLPNVNHIGPRAFSNCEGLTKVVVKEGTDIDRTAFAGCKNINIEYVSENDIAKTKQTDNEVSK